MKKSNFDNVVEKIDSLIKSLESLTGTTTEELAKAKVRVGPTEQQKLAQDRAKNKMQPVKSVSPEEKAKMLADFQAKIEREAPQKEKELKAKQSVSRWGDKKQAVELNRARLEQGIPKTIRRPAPVKKSEEDTGADKLALTIHNKLFGDKTLKQPTDQEMFGHLVANEQELAKQDTQWNNSINNWLVEATKPISQKFASEEEEAAYWNSIKISDRDDGKSGY